MKALIAIDAEVEDRILETADLTGSRHQLTHCQRLDLFGITEVDEHIPGFCLELLQAIVSGQTQEAELLLIEHHMIEMRLRRLLGFAVVDNRYQHLYGIPFAVVHKLHQVGQLVIIRNNEYALYLLPVQELLPAFRHFFFRNEPQCYVLNNGHYLSNEM